MCVTVFAGKHLLKQWLCHAYSSEFVCVCDHLACVTMFAGKRRLKQWSCHAYSSELSGMRDRVCRPTSAEAVVMSLVQFRVVVMCDFSGKHLL